MISTTVCGRLNKSKCNSLLTVEDDRFDDFLAEVQERFARLVGEGVPLYTTDAEGLWEKYLDAAPPGSRQSRDCRCCRSFIEKFGGLVTINEYGATTPVMWTFSAPPAYHDASRALFSRVEKANVTGMFVASEKTWGTPNTGPWTHFSITPPKGLVFKSPLLTAGQKAAEKLEERRMLERGLDEFSRGVVKVAHTYLENGSLFRSEKCVGVAWWLLRLHETMTLTKNTRLRSNLLWKAVASAPAGYCHVKSGMIGTLLEDISAGVPFQQIKARFDAKMSPLQYQRPQAAPKAGNVAQAEKIIATLNAEGALDRRFARLSDVQTIWKPAALERSLPNSPVFGHLLSKPAVTRDGSGPITTMTWVKFQNKVLPTADKIEYVPKNVRAQYVAMVTAANPNSPPILQWDRPEKRNQVSWYTYSGGKLPGEWNLTANIGHVVTGISLKPSTWDDKRSYPQHGHGVLFIVENCRDAYYNRSAGLFPELLRSEYHAVRSTIEAYSKEAVIAGKSEASACGIFLGGNDAADIHLIVTSNGIKSTYRLDRWD
jgi:hypothetical protein